MNVDTEDTPIDAYNFIMSPDRRVKSLAPVSHETGEGLYRVPVQIENELHTIYVADNHRRMFDTDTLPDFMKHKLSIIAVSSQGELLNDLEVTWLHLFATKKGDLERIGWRVSSSFYIVVLNDSELESLKGSA